MNKKKKPRIRFKGFTDDWEQRKLGHIVGRVTRKNKDLVSTLPLTISAQYGLIDQNEFFDKRIASKDVSNYYLIHKGEFAYNKSTSIDAPWGAIKRLDRYENGVLSTLYIIFRILDENQMNSDYLASYYNTALWHKSIRVIASEGARNHGLLNIAPDDFFETTLMIPRDIDEQKKIGAYLKNIDDLITLHQRKCEKLKIIKKAMLENCFPKNGQKVPKIRFSGFTGDWEQRKVSDLFKVTRGHVLSTDKIVGKKDDLNQYPVYSSQTANNGLMGYYENYLYENAITWTTDGANAGTVRYRAGKFYCTNVCGVLLSDKTDASKMIAEALNRVAKKHVSYVGNPKLMNNVMSDIFITVCTNVIEQKWISAYFQNLDNLITLHQSKLEKLQKIKKSMLERMFV